jgi:predicted transcriptional regulator
MAKEAVFTMKLEPELRDAFMAEAEAADRPASQIVREMMRDFVKKRRDEREYVEFVRRKVEIARAQIEAGKFVSQEQIEADVAARRADLLRRSGEDAA